MAEQERGDWLDERKEMLVQRLQDDYKPFERDLLDEFARHDREKNALSKHISSLVIKASRGDELENENKLLKAQVAAAIQPGTTSSHVATSIEPPQEPMPYENYAQLAKKYDTLRQNCEKLKKANDDLREKSHRLKKQWQKHSDMRRVIEADEDRAKATTPAYYRPSPSVDTPTSVDSAAISAIINEAQQSVLEPPQPETLSASHNPGQVESEHVTSSQTTEDDIPVGERTPQVSAQDTAPNDDEDDVPIFVSERCLKRKAHKDTKDGNPPNPTTRVKHEPSSSPIIMQQVPPHRLHRIDTLDLDRVGSPIETPRKRRRVEQVLQHSQNEPVRVAAMRSLLGERSLSEPSNVDDQQVEKQAEKNRIRIKAEPFAENDRAASLPTAIENPRDHARDDGTPSRNRQAQALQPLDPNSRLVPPNVGLRPRRTRSDKDRGAKYIHLLSEDGEERTPTSPAIKAEPVESLQRLNALLEAPASAEKPIISPKKQPAAPRKSHGSTAGPAKARSDRQEPSAKPSPAPKSATPKAPNSGSRGFLGRRNPGPPLRQRPVEKLNLADFKINPRNNQGLDQAFNEVVRGRASRRCLPGCIDPACCGGKFRAMAEAGPTPEMPRGLWASTQEGETNEDRFLNWHLGDAYSKERLDVMPSVQKQELLLQAKTRWYADHHGKHRKAHERRASPPGFWRTDMPSTQEIERNREEANVRERLEVEQRRMEAMRPGGRWLFKDE